MKSIVSQEIISMNVHRSLPFSTYIQFKGSSIIMDPGKSVK